MSSLTSSITTKSRPIVSLRSSCLQHTCVHRSRTHTPQSHRCSSCQSPTTIKILAIGRFLSRHDASLRRYRWYVVTVSHTQSGISRTTSLKLLESLLTLVFLLLLLLVRPFLQFCLTSLLNRFYGLVFQTRTAPSISTTRDSIR